MSPSQPLLLFTPFHLPAFAPSLALDVSDARLVERAYEDLTGEIIDVARDRARNAMFNLRTRLAFYPPQYTGRMPGGFKTLKQRRYFFWALKQGIIQVPYQRTGAYGRGWQITEFPNAFLLTGNARQGERTYTGWVAGDVTGKYQARIHRGRWTTVPTAVEQTLKPLPQEITNRTMQVVHRRGF
jgi:hypothetical protein